MEDVITATDQRLANTRNLKQIRNNPAYLIDFSVTVGADVAEIWRYLQSGILHKAPAVLEANTRATRIVTDLFLWFCLQPGLIESHFREAHRRLCDTKYIKWYLSNVGVMGGIPKRLVEKFCLASTIGIELKSSGDNWSVPIYNIILAKDYVASLTDSRAIAEHGRLWNG